MSTTLNSQAAERKSAPAAWTFHKVNLKLHLWLGLGSAIFLLILGVTGAIIAFEAEVDHWVHPGLWSVKATGQPLPEAQLIANVERQFAPGKVRGVALPRSRDLAQVMIVSGKPGAPEGRNGLQVFVNPYDGAITGSRYGPSGVQRVFGTIHQFHLRIAMGDPGKLIVSIAGVILVFECIFGLILWWRLKRATIRLTGASWFRVCFDLHNAIGIYSAVFLLLISITGVLIGFDFVEPIIFKLTHSEPLLQRRPAASTVVEGGAPITVDQAMAAAREAMPNATIATIQPPATPKGAYYIGMRVPEETSEAVHSSVAVDQFSGKVLRVQNFMTESLGYRVIRYNRSLHTGDVLGFWGHVIMSLTSLVLVGMVITGIVIWWKKLAV